MIKLIDGPAAGTVLQLRRGPLFLRVVVNAKGEWDGLDQPEDTVRPDETPHCYVAVDGIGMCHIRSGKPGASGFYAIGNYRHLHSPGPSVTTMRINEEWRAWCYDNRDLVAHLVKP